ELAADHDGVVGPRRAGGVVVPGAAVVGDAGERAAHADAARADLVGALEAAGVRRARDQHEEQREALHGVPPGATGVICASGPLTHTPLVVSQNSPCAWKQSLDTLHVLSGLSSNSVQPPANTRTTSKAFTTAPPSRSRSRSRRAPRSARSRTAR